MNLTELREATIRRGKEWGTDGFNPCFRATELAGEVGEACNVVKKLERRRMDIVGDGGVTLKDLGEEIADVIISADILASQYGIDLSLAVREKFNKTSDKYGLKTKL